MIVDGVSTNYKTSVGTLFSGNTLRLFKDNFSNSTAVYSYFNGNRLYSFKIYESDVLVRNMIPCTYKGVPGMWDRVENVFYGNKGTAYFIVGND